MGPLELVPAPYNGTGDFGHISRQNGFCPAGVRCGSLAAADGLAAALAAAQHGASAHASKALLEREPSISTRLCWCGRGVLRVQVRASAGTIVAERVLLTSSGRVFR